MDINQDTLQGEGLTSLTEAQQVTNNSQYDSPGVDLLSAPASEAYVERIFFLCGL